MRVPIAGLLIVIPCTVAFEESQIFAKSFCRAALASDLAFCDPGIGECSIRASYADQRVIRGELRIPCTPRFLAHMERRFSSFVEYIFPAYAPAASKFFTTVDGSAAIPFEHVLSSYSKFLATDLSNLLIPAHLFRDSQKILRLIEMRIFCPASTWFSDANMPSSVGDFDELFDLVSTVPILTPKTWSDISTIATRGNLPQSLTRHIGEYLGYTIQSKNLLSDDARFNLLMSGSGLSNRHPLSNELLVGIHAIVSRLVDDARFECTTAFLEICIQNVLSMLGVSRGGGRQSALEILKQVNERDRMEKIIPARLVRAFYKAFAGSNTGHLIGASQREPLSHHMLTSTYPNQQFVSEFVEGVLVRYSVIPEGVPSIDEVQSFLTSIGERVESESIRCVIETAVIQVALKSGVGKIASIFCKRSLMDISASSLFSGITELMHTTTIESYLTFHRMFRFIPVMGMIREILEMVGYQFASTSLSNKPFHDPRMVEVYTAFMKACASLESTAKQYHIMFGRRGERQGW